MQCLHLGVRNEIGLTGDLGEQVGLRTSPKPC